MPVKWHKPLVAAAQRLTQQWLHTAEPLIWRLTCAVAEACGVYEVFVVALAVQPHKLVVLAVSSAF
jgi:hypothetical protein